MNEGIDVLRPVIVNLHDGTCSEWAAKIELRSQEPRESRDRLVCIALGLCRVGGIAYGRSVQEELSILLNDPDGRSRQQVDGSLKVMGVSLDADETASHPLPSRQLPER
jgi:hypothetical protein